MIPLIVKFIENRFEVQHGMWFHTIKVLQMWQKISSFLSITRNDNKDRYMLMKRNFKYNVKVFYKASLNTIIDKPKE